MLVTVVAVTLVLAAQSQCAAAKPQLETFSTLRGAFLLEDGAAPWLVSLRYSGDRDGRNFKDYPYCGGSVLNATHIITSARCVENPALQDLNSPLITAQAGSVHRNKAWDDTAQVRPITELSAHKGFTPNSKRIFDQKNDIAVAKVKDVFNMTSKFAGIPLRRDAVPAGTECKVYGWGDIIETNGTEYSKGGTRAKYVEVVIMSQEDCAVKLNKKVSDLQGLICTMVPDGKKFPCLGDSGGSLVCDGQLAGVTPEGVRCGPNEERPDLPDLHVDTVQLRGWIETGGAAFSAPSTGCLLLVLLVTAWWR